MRSFESREDYLEAILVLQNEKGAVRSIDIAAKLGFTKPSVSRAMGLLRGAEYITVDRDGFIRLTETGRAAAESVYERHRLLTDCLIRLGVSPETAAEDACRVEHVISARLTGTTARNGLRAQDVPAKTPEDNPRRKAAKRQARP